MIHTHYLSRVNPVQRITPVARVSGAAVIARGIALEHELEADHQFLGHLKSGAIAISHPIKDLIAKIIEQQREHVPLALLREQTKLHRQHIANSKLFARDHKRLRQMIRRTTKGSTGYELDLFAALCGLADDGDEDLRNLGYGEEALLDFASEHEQLLLASKHIHQEVLQHVALGEDGSALKALYEEAIVKTTSVVAALRELARQGGEKTITLQRAFLNNAVASDLASVDMGGEKVHLEILLRELKGLRIYNALTHNLASLQEKRLPAATTTAPDHVFLQTLEYVDNPYGVLPQFEQWVSSALPDDQILFFQDYRNIYHNIPTEAYTNEEQKINSKRVIQDKIDQLIYSQ